MQPQTLIIRTAGTNCDLELAHAFERAGAVAQRVHLNQLIADPSPLERAGIIAFPGGFSYGDDIAAGRIFANRLRHRLLPALLAAVRRGTPMLGVCNGFQVIAKLGLLPDADGVQSATLADNLSRRFQDRWVGLEAPANTLCVWTKGLGRLELPIAHGEGRFAADPALLDRLEAGGQVALRYTDNPNGSARAIAGVCDPTGLVLGLMPHPERFTEFSHHPAWTRQPVDGGEPAGLRMIRNAVAYVAQRGASAPALAAGAA